jgi:hypothetical protein
LKLWILRAKGEAFVESRFLTPLLACLGYESHKDYEVIRHGDEGPSIKLHYPPVEKGAQRVKHYNPDYVQNAREGFGQDCVKRGCHPAGRHLAG